MKKQKSKQEISGLIDESMNSITRSVVCRLDKINRDDLVSALVSLQKAEEILKQK